MALSTQVRAFPWKYDVFLSFRGEDTRRGFTDYLYKELKRRGITTFRDDPDLERGTAVSPELLSAIEHSRFAIVVLSPHYASSSWCLLELSKILQCMEERGTILPVFYEVDPSDVRHQRGSFAESFDEHEEKLGGDSKEVEGWRDALTKVANFAGWSLKDYRYETDLIKEIVQALWTKVHPSLTLFRSSEKLVGMDTKLEEVDVLLDKEANDVRFIGIWGMGGLGKTTLARLVYEKISDQFEVCIFLSNVREVSKTHGLVHLQKQMLSQILKEENVQVWDVYSGITMTKRCLCNKAVLLVLDDVDQEEQLENLVGEKDGFGLRSRIIITTRNRHVLVTHGIEKPYELKGLNKAEAHQLFSLKAFMKYEPEADYAEQSKSFVDYAGGIPLALKTLGSFLYGRSPQAWSSALEELRKTPDTTVFDLLKLSYDGLNEMQKKTFLDITCFSSQYVAKFIIELLTSFDIRTLIAIDVLVEKSLLTISSDNEIGIHDLIREMGYKIVRQESSEEPGERSRLWLRKDIFHVFKMNRGTEAIEGIFLHLHKLEEADWNLEAFSKMCRLKLLYIHNLRLSSGPKYLPDALRFLKWSWYPSKSLPLGFQPDELTVLSLIHSNIDHLWKGIKYLGKLKSMDLSHSLNLTRTPVFTGTPNLEELVLEGCTNLVKIHPSIALLKRLRIWNFRNCKSIKSLPSEVEMESLVTFDVSGCSKLKMVPEFLGQMKRLSKLRLGGTAVGKLPSSFEHLSSSLEELDLSGIVVRKLSAYAFFPKLNVNGKRPRSWHSWLPSGLFARKNPHPLTPLLSSLKHLSSLTHLFLNDCNLFEGEIPNDIGSLSSLMELELGGNNFVTLPASIHLLSELRILNVQNCRRLQTLPDLPCNGRLTMLRVRADNCSSLQVFQNPSNWQRSLNAINCVSAVNQDASYFLYSFLKRLLEQGTTFFWGFNFIIPASEIPEWINNQSEGDWVIEKIPSYACDRNWMGFAVCALFGPQHDPSAVPDQEFTVWCTWDPHGGTDCVGYTVKLIVSDHLVLFVLHSDWWRNSRKWRKNDTCNVVKFYFQIWQHEVNERIQCSSMKVKKCGARALYEHETEELISRMNRSKSSISLYESTNCDLSKSSYEQGDVFFKGTTTGNGCSDDEYYSAEE